MDGDDCPCGSGLDYRDCCGPLHDGTAGAATAQALMRSRFSAFALRDPAYLLGTWHPSTRPTSLALDPAIEWRRLQIRASTGGGERDSTGTVAFVAHYWDATRREYGRQHEDSRFIREAGRWFYVDAVR